MYPFSTQNPTDFNNLLSVYLDAVFYPRLRELDFRYYLLKVSFMLFKCTSLYVMCRLFNKTLIVVLPSHDEIHHLCFIIYKAVDTIGYYSK